MKKSDEVYLFQIGPLYYINENRILDITENYLLQIVDESMNNREFKKLLDQVLTELEKDSDITNESKEELEDRIDIIMRVD